MERSIFVFSTSMWVIGLGLLIASYFGEDVIFNAWAFMMIGTLAGLMKHMIKTLNARIQWLEEELARRQKV